MEQDEAPVEAGTGVDVADVQRWLLGILKDVSAVCERHEIRFYLAYGTLLGAVRHHGFVPWDDDVDIWMTRDQYERFFAVRNELGPDYVVQEWRTTPEYWNFHPKVRLLRPKPYVEQRIADVTDADGLFLDIFLLDAVPRPAGLAQSAVSALLAATRVLLSAKQYGHHDPSPAVRALSRVARLVPKRALAGVMLWGATLWDGAGEKGVAEDGAAGQADGPAFAGPDRSAWLLSYGSPMRVRGLPAPAWAYGEPVRLRFEDVTMPCPREYDRLLRQRYGDYMALPPADKRVPEHTFLATGETAAQEGGQA